MTMCHIPSYTCSMYMYILKDILICNCSFSFVVHYILEEKTSHSGKVSFHSDKQGHKYLALVSVN